MDKKLTKNTKITKALVRQIAEESVAALEQVAEKHGVSISRKGSISFTELEFTLPLLVVVNNEDLLLEKKRSDFEWHARIHRFNPSGFGQTIRAGGKTIRVCGFNPKARTYPIEGEGADGTNYKMSIEQYSLHFPLDN